MAIERNDTPYEQQNQAKTSWLGEDLFKKMKNLFPKEGQDYDQETVSVDAEEQEEKETAIRIASVEQWLYSNDLVETLGVDPEIVNDPSAYAQKNIVEKWNREHGVKPLESIW